MNLIIDLGRMLSAPEVAEWLNVRVITVYKWTSQERIPHVHLSRRAVRYPEDLIKEWISSHTHMVTDAKKMTKTKRKRKLKRRLGWRKSEVDCIIASVKREVFSE